MDVSALLLRDYHDLTRQELIARLRQVKLLQARVTYTHDNLSPRVMQALGVAILLLLAVFSLTDSIIFAGLVCLVTLAGVLRYSKLPMDWCSQLNTGIAQMELLRGSPLRQFTGGSNTLWEYTQYCLEEEIHLIHVALQQPSEPFTA
ncbi:MULTISPECIES: hypothetical protein [Yersinia]|nr:MULTISPECIES: hypothetical protein [Yersinia]EKN3637359.1 hypothetical protein [Yersinia enterocolitica]OJB86358.1 hypothetical protein A9Q61_17785 [Yersinia ruckeri]ELI8280718.1 hypothetical protein [Yersinia enterocolitica]MCB5314353.1 hypothetical protein [Yersinia intermedia]MCB5324768.1 hypothetical protein [Yersinia intermedia]